jgi:hypothetical protein
MEDWKLKIMIKRILACSDRRAYQILEQIRQDTIKTREHITEIFKSHLYIDEDEINSFISKLLA